MKFRGILFIIAIGIAIQSKSQDIIVDTTTGVGKTCEESKLNAFANALNKIGGTYVNGVAKISNDELLANNITAITLGGIITKPRILKSCYINNDKLYESVWEVTISKNGYFDFIKSKNNTISLNGSYIKLEMDKLNKNEMNETKSVENILEYLNEPMSSAFEYEMNLENNNFKIVAENVEIPINIKIKYNDNIDIVRDYLINNIEKVSLKQSSIDFINKHYKDARTYPININDNVYYFQRKESVQKILNFYKRYINSVNQFKIENDCNDKINFFENYKTRPIVSENIEIGFGGQEFQRIFGKIILLKDEINKVNNIQISSIDNPLNKSKSVETKRYANTNPFEFGDLNTQLLKKLDSISNGSESGTLGFNFTIQFNENGKPKNEFLSSSKERRNEKNYGQLGNFLMNYDLTPSQKCNGFIKSEDTIKVQLSWETSNKTYIYAEDSKSDIYQSWFAARNLQYGKYTISTKEKNLNGKIFRTISVDDMTTVGGEAVIQSMFIPGSGIKSASYSKQNGKAQFWGVLLPLTLSVATHFASTATYNQYIKEPTDENYDIANNLNKGSIVLGGWSIINYFRQIFKTGKIVHENTADKEKLNSLISQGNNFIVMEKLN